MEVKETEAQAAVAAAAPLGDVLDLVTDQEEPGGPPAKPATKFVLSAASPPFSLPTPTPLPPVERDSSADHEDPSSAPPRTQTVVSVPTPPVTASASKPAPAALAPAAVAALTAAELDDVVVWSGTDLCSAVRCRGWMRPQHMWRRGTDVRTGASSAARAGGGGGAAAHASAIGAALAHASLPPALVRCAEDGKYRSRLCNHWDDSCGAFCPMRRKGRCDFAHGPVELRVREHKRNRWGRSVDERGECSNALASGGEDTYGAAQNIERMRREDGRDAADKWRRDDRAGNRRPKRSAGVGGGGGGGGTPGRGGPRHGQPRVVASAT